MIRLNPVRVAAKQHWWRCFKMAAPRMYRRKHFSLREKATILAVFEDDLDVMSYLLQKPTHEAAIYKSYERFDFDAIPETDAKVYFRFNKPDITRLLNALQLPETIVCPDRTVSSDLEGLCIFLRRMSYPNRLSDLEKDFGRSRSSLSIIANTVCELILQRHGHLLHDLRQPWLLESLNNFAEAVHDKVAPMDNIWGFTDGTVRPICRPKYNQRLVYNGHKRVHALKYQSIVVPNGMIANMFGPVEGRRHDSCLLRESGILDDVVEFQRNGRPLALYGDPAYPLRPQLIAPYQGAALTPDEQQFNRSMSLTRVAVEWTFAKIVSEWAFLDFKKNQKIYLQPVGTQYLVGALLTNFHTCLYGSETGQFFRLQPPSLEDYIYGR